MGAWRCLKCIREVLITWCIVDVKDVFTVFVVAIGYGSVLLVALFRSRVPDSVVLSQDHYQPLYISPHSADRMSYRVRLILAQALVQGQGLNSVRGFMLAESQGATGRHMQSLLAPLSLLIKLLGCIHEFCFAGLIQSILSPNPTSYTVVGSNFYTSNT